MKSKHQYFVTGIGTDVGKTVVSAVLVKALNADYWKPVQSGDLHQSDTIKIRKWCEIYDHKRIHEETYKLNEPISPHASAAIEDRRIELDKFTMPETNNSLIVEGAGGLAVPLNEKETMLDLMKQLGMPILLVVRNYLGSINHTLLSIMALRQNDIPIKGMILFDSEVKSSESVIAKMSKVPFLFRVSNTYPINSDFITSEALKSQKEILNL